ncbi:MAG: sigma 54-interacting transcriptional regulator, partial [Rhizobiaceae bacterium]|nr:sigma 54-interacting transcriptional regulator [Rhizobiaceae bacterium]
LRVLETGQYEVLGSSNTKMANIRLISATNANLGLWFGFCFRLRLGFGLSFRFCLGFLLCGALGNFSGNQFKRFFQRY